MGVLRIAALLAFLYAPAASAMSMHVVDDQVILSGEVQMGDFERLKNRLTEHQGRITTVVLRNSPGGAVQPMYNLMKLIREQNLKTAVSGYCVSACAMIFLGGRERTFTDELPPGNTFVAFHGPHNQNGTVSTSDTAIFKQVIAGYADGKIDEALFEKLIALNNPGGLMYFFDSKRLKRADGMSVFLCRGDEKKKVDDCEKITGKNPYDAGVFTSPTPISVKKP